MNGSWLIAGVTLGTFLLFAAGGWWVALRMKDRRQRNTTHLKVGFLIVLGVVFATYAFWTDSQQRRTTLHEIILDGTSAKDAIFQVEFNIEHAGVEHDLLIGPMFRPPTLERADYEIRLAATLEQQDGTVLLSDEYTFQPRTRGTAWHAEYLHFTPQTTGQHILTLNMLSPNIPAVHVRVADPLKTDGKRAPGY
ncbi:MAG: hypothetical protein KDA93_13715 [Planctomycetaceae bacterium]|nr:hypothetical protein [Planctomycetaceae bacterium]